MSVDRIRQEFRDDWTKSPYSNSAVVLAFLVCGLDVAVVYGDIPRDFGFLLSPEEQACTATAIAMPVAVLAIIGLLRDTRRLNVVIAVVMSAACLLAWPRILVGVYGDEDSACLNHLRYLRDQLRDVDEAGYIGSATPRQRLANSPRTRDRMWSTKWWEIKTSCAHQYRADSIHCLIHKNSMIYGLSPRNASGEGIDKRSRALMSGDGASAE